MKKILMLSFLGILGYIFNPIIIHAEETKYKIKPVIANGKLVSCEALFGKAAPGTKQCLYTRLDVFELIIDDVYIDPKTNKKVAICQGISSSVEQDKPLVTNIPMTCKQLAQNIDDAFKYVGLK